MKTIVQIVIETPDQPEIDLVYSVASLLNFATSEIGTDPAIKYSVVEKLFDHPADYDPPIVQPDDSDSFHLG